MRNNPHEAHLPRGRHLLELVAQEYETILLSFSLGKDSIAAWITMREVFDTGIIPLYRYIVPGLSFIEESIDYFERYFKTRIIQLPHPATYRMFNNGVFQYPWNMAVIQACGFLEPTYQQVNEAACEIVGADYKKAVNAVGVRASDSAIRTVAVRRHGVIIRSKQTFYPIWDWTMDDIVEAIQKHKVKLPVDYRMFGRSFDGLYWRYVIPIKQHYPKDYDLLCRYFPQLDAEIARYQFQMKRRGIMPP